MTQVKLELWFVGSGKVASLFKTVVHEHENVSATVAQRGQSPTGKIGGFQWSAAVQSLMILFLDYAASGADAALVGVAGSPASSLDYALSKGPVWMLDMLGVGADGGIRLRELLIRTNAERKRPGPVEIRVNARNLKRDAIRVFHEEIEITDSEALARLARDIGSVWVGRGSQAVQSNLVTSTPVSAESETSVLNTPEACTLAWNRLHEEYVRSIRARLFHTEIFDRQEYRDRIGRLFSHPDIRRLVGRRINPDEFLDTSLAGFRRLGIAADKRVFRPLLEMQRPLRVAMAWSIPGGVLLFRYLQRRLGIPIELDTGFLHSSELSDSICERPVAGIPDVSLMSPGNGSLFLHEHKSLKLKPLMLGPSSNMAVLRKRRPGSAPKRLGGNFAFMSDVPSTGYLFYQELVTSGVIDDRQSRSLHNEPDGIARSLHRGDHDTYGILWFPYCLVNELFNGCERVARGTSSSIWADSIILARDEIYRNRPLATALVSAIHHAWWVLRTSDEILREEVSAMFDEPVFADYLSRSSGLVIPPLIRAA